MCKQVTNSPIFNVTNMSRLTNSPIFRVANISKLTNSPIYPVAQLNWSTVRVIRWSWVSQKLRRYNNTAGFNGDKSVKYQCSIRRDARHGGRISPLSQHAVTSPTVDSTRCRNLRPVASATPSLKLPTWSQNWKLWSGFGRAFRSVSDRRRLADTRWPRG